MLAILIYFVKLFSRTKIFWYIYEFLSMSEKGDLINRGQILPNKGAGGVQISSERRIASATWRIDFRESMLRFCIQR